MGCTISHPTIYFWVAKKKKIKTLKKYNNKHPYILLCLSLTDCPLQVLQQVHVLEHHTIVDAEARVTLGFADKCSV